MSSNKQDPPAGAKPHFTGGCRRRRNTLGRAEATTIDRRCAFPVVWHAVPLVGPRTDTPTIFPDPFPTLDYFPRLFPGAESDQRSPVYPNMAHFTRLLILFGD
jgi:hypothetical protein